MMHCDNGHNCTSYSVRRNSTSLDNLLSRIFLLWGDGRIPARKNRSELGHYCCIACQMKLRVRLIFLNYFVDEQVHLLRL